MNPLFTSPSLVRATVAKLKGEHLRALVDAAQDVAKNSYDPQLQRSAQIALEQVRHDHPTWKI